MGGLSITHWAVVLIAVLLLFGRNRISGTMGEIGEGLKQFRKGIADDRDEAGPPPLA